MGHCRASGLGFTKYTANKSWYSKTGVKSRESLGQRDIAREREERERKRER